MKSLKTLFLTELADIYYAEKRIAQALPEMAKAASSNDLKVAFEGHIDETKSHITKLEEVFAHFDLKVEAETGGSTIGRAKEREPIVEKFKDSPMINAALIFATQKVEPYEMATYGCLHEWAELLGCNSDASLLKEILNEDRVDPLHSTDSLTPKSMPRHWANRQAQKTRIFWIHELVCYG